MQNEKCKIKNSKILRVFIFVFVCLFFLSKGGWAMEIKSTAFKNNEYIPVKYTCQGQNVSPDLSWSGVSKDTKSFALICDDPDAPMGTWVHWVIFNIPVSVNELTEGASKSTSLPKGVIEGLNSSGIGYDGPCPPPGKPHHYFFKLYALDIGLETDKPLNKEKLLKEMNGHILAQAQIVGLYKR
jgi:Raf kinase inhibitor-like YbhB/YbcL family protein